MLFTEKEKGERNRILTDICDTVLLKIAFPYIMFKMYAKNSRVHYKPAAEHLNWHSEESSQLCTLINLERKRSESSKGSACCSWRDSTAGRYLPAPYSQPGFDP